MYSPGDCGGIWRKRGKERECKHFVISDQEFPPGRSVAFIHTVVYIDLIHKYIVVSIRREGNVKLCAAFPKGTTMSEHLCFLSREELPTRFRSYNTPDHQR
jgi:hypothetical protein